MAIPASNISEVIAELDNIITECLAENNKMGLFAALYRKVTIRVQAGIAAGRFDGGARMERLDVVFANRFLEAYQAHHLGKPVTSSWRISFEAAKRHNLLIIQHLLVGMNAHISLDLGIATATVAVGAPLSDLARDFNEINRLLAEMIDEVQSVLNHSSIVMTTLDLMAGKLDEKLARFNLELFRKRAWQTANDLYTLNNIARKEHIYALDAVVSKENQWFTNLGSGLLLPFTRMAALVQNRKIGLVIQAFNAI